ncbi:Bgt-51178 [Blumeria graminis f. sp. tritici]|uniref:Bgt-51178 n=1 Tax=Blumeria graminis f. sp. tritici TaxID=62690 RepID=A0A9X9MJP8_BLUGR|nr:Bgt-51178 [Blumeria graminis f. sp. tritici]
MSIYLLGSLAQNSRTSNYFLFKNIRTLFTHSLEFVPSST